MPRSSRELSVTDESPILLIAGVCKDHGFEQTEYHIDTTSIAYDAKTIIMILIALSTSGMHRKLFYYIGS